MPAYYEEIEPLGFSWQVKEERIIDTGIESLCEEVCRARRPVTVFRAVILNLWVETISGSYIRYCLYISDIIIHYN